ncbi:hypothetical protein [Terrisporobacter petrolearius]|uniref:hypothetical protein n=1 Tax=Terrisporobacter petrolearius TaxID=1460447 RepID=UPI0031CC9974
MNIPNGFESGKDKDKLKLTVKLTETDIFQGVLKVCSAILEDERIDKSIREEYAARFEKFFDKALSKQEQSNTEEKEFEKIKDACEQVVALLRHDKNYNPHMTVIIKADEIKVVSDEMNIPLK